MSKLDAAIVIPSHDEGADILHVLASIARQKGIENNKVGVFVVINQIRNAALQIGRSNAETAQVIRSLQQGAMPGGLSDEPRKIIFPSGADVIYGPAGEVVISLKQAAGQVLNTGVRIEEVNLWEGDKAPQNCNVGIARHTGTVEAIKNLRDEECPIMGTDADAVLGLDRVRNVIDIFKRNPNLMAARGTLHVFQSKDHRDIRLVSASFLSLFNTIFEDLDDITFALMTGGRPNLTEDGMLEAPNQEGAEPLWTLDGINMNFRASLYREIQFEPISGEEDTKFGQSIMEKGYKIENHGDKVATATTDRISTRATTGMGQQLVNDFMPFADRPDEFLVAGLAATKLKVAIVKTLGKGLKDCLGEQRKAVGLVERNYRSLINLGLNHEEVLDLATHIAMPNGWAEFSFQLSALCIANRPSTLPQAFEEVINFLEQFQRKNAQHPDRAKIEQLIKMVKEQREKFRTIKQLLELGRAKAIF